MSFLQANQAIQKVLKDRVRGLDEGLLRAVVDASRFNSVITVEDLRYDLGKKRKVKTIFYGPQCEDDGTCSDNICEDGTKIEPTIAEYTIAQCTASSVYTLSVDDVRLFDGNWTFSEHAKQQIASVMPTVRRKLAAAVAAKLAAAAGVLPNGNDTETLPFISNETGALTPVGMDRIRQAFFDTGYGDPFIVGSGQMFNYAATVRRGGLNAQGQYVDRMGVENLYYDKNVTLTYGSEDRDDIIAFDPQMIKFVTFNRNVGMFGTDIRSIDQLDVMYQRGGTDYAYGLMEDPATGITWDFEMIYDKCDKVFNFQIKLEWELFTMPPMVCLGVSGINGIFHFQSCPYTITECTGTPVSPATAATYRYDGTDLTYPLAVYSLRVGTQNSSPNITIADVAELRAMLNDNSVGYTFAGSGDNVDYQGYSGISFAVNGGAAQEFTAV